MGEKIRQFSSLSVTFSHSGDGDMQIKANPTVICLYEIETDLENQEAKENSCD